MRAVKRPPQREVNMKTNKASLLLGIGTGVLFLSASISAQSFSGSGVLPRNSDALSSPRIFEQFPELLRISALTEKAAAKSRTERLAKLTENRALAASPRFKEEHPELLKVERPALTKQSNERVVELTSNRALLTSPRFLEEHPEVLRSSPEFQVAPLK